MQDITKLTVIELSRALERKEISAAEAALSYLDRIQSIDGEVNAYLAITSDLALERAAQIDRRRAAGERLPKLAGVPMGVKDNICTQGVVTTCASKMLEHFAPPYDAAVMEKLEDCVMLGKLNMDEFAMGSSTENSYFKVTHNPRSLDRVPGGSSGGSAAAVAAGEAPFALGSDTGGSIRQPAAFCGVVGIKPTYGSVSRYGLIAFASSLDQIGALTRNVSDSALVMNAITGHDKRDATSVNRSYADYTALLGREVKGMRIGMPMEYYAEGLSSEIRESIYAAAEKLRALGAEIIEISMKSVKYALPAYYVISSAEASSNLARFDGVKYGYRSEKAEGILDLYCSSRSEGFGSEVKRRIMLGSFALSSGYYDAYYKKALQVRTIVSRDFESAFESCDLVLSPVAPTTAYRIGEKTDNPLEMYMGDVYTVPINIAGLPALSMPCGKDREGLPIGLQFIGRAFGEQEIYRAAYALEQEIGGIFA